MARTDALRFARGVFLHSEERELSGKGTIFAGFRVRRARPGMPETALPDATNAIESAFRQIIQAIGDNPDRDGLRGTPARIAKMYTELFRGVGVDPRRDLTVEFDLTHDGIVVLKDVPFHSMCEHHFLPFFGVVHLGYRPANGRVVGISKLARVVATLSRRPQIQERLTDQIADAIADVLEPLGVGVVLSASHQCVEMRGVEKPGSRVVTSAFRGCFEDPIQRAEFWNLLRA